MVLRFTIALLVSSTLALSPDGKCRVLVLRGGGVHGAFEVGALKAMIETLDPSEYAYDYVSGISIGALNGSILSTFEKGNEAQALGKLYDFFTGNLFSDYLDLWPNIWYNAFVKSSIINPKRAFEFIDGLIGSEPFKRKFSWLSVNIANSQVVIFDEKTPLEVRNKAIFSSASIPFVLPPVELDGMFLVDGGSFANASVGDPIRRCQEEEGV
jgi:NTE family protein